MSAPIVQAQYDRLTDIAQRFQRQSDVNAELKQRLLQHYQPLQQGGWQGRGAQAFFAEMENEVFPAMDRLIQALSQASQVTIQIQHVLREAEEEAARPFRQGETSASGSAPGAGGAPAAPPPPRIYIVNGINSAGNVPGQIGDDQSVALRELLIAHGYDPDQVVATPAIYLTPRINWRPNFEGTHYGGLLSPVDWITGKLAQGANTLVGGAIHQANRILGNTVVSSLYGSAQVVREYVQGSQGPYTQQVYQFILNDLQRHPLAPGQSIILMGHSGGGAVVANLAGMIERGTGRNVSGVVTMGSPVSNYDEAGRYAETIVQIRHQRDLIGLPAIRSEESRVTLPTSLIFAPSSGGRSLITWPAVEMISRYTGPRPPMVVDVTLQSPVTGILDAHGSYMNSGNSASQQMLDTLHRLFPSMPLH